MKHTWVIILAMTISLVAPNHLALACGGGGGGGDGGGNDPSEVSTGSSTTTGDPGEAPAGITMTEPPPITTGPVGTTSPGPGIGSVVEEEPTESEGEPQDPWQTLVDTLNKQREKLGLPPIQNATLPGGIAVVNGRVVPVEPSIREDTTPSPPAPNPDHFTVRGREMFPAAGSGLGGRPITQSEWDAMTPEQQDMMRTGGRVAANVTVAQFGGVVGGKMGKAIVATWGAASTHASGGTKDDAGLSASLNVATFSLPPIVGEAVSTAVMEAKEALEQ